MSEFHGVFCLFMRLQYSLYFTAKYGAFINRLIQRGIPLFVLLYMGNCFAEEPPAETDTFTTEYLQLQKDYHGFLENYFDQGEKDKAKSAKKISIEQVFRHTKTALDRDNIPQALSLVQTHTPVILDHIDSKQAHALIGLAIRYDVGHLVSRFTRYARNNAGGYANANINYLLALDAYDHHDFQSTIRYLADIESGGALTTKKRDYATLLFGTSLQHTRKHREAIDFYQKLDPKSAYYKHALLNLAVAYIRQGWWTDAQIAINKAIEAKGANEDPEFINRLYVVLGYSQLKHEFYRNARETFRHVEIDSQYMSRALLGIGLCALGQKDYVGALNAFKRLKEVPHYDITIAESNLLVPFTIERMRELEIASAGYTEAIAYFGSKIREFNNYSPDVIAELPASDPAFRVLTPLPDYLFHQLTLLQQLQQATAGAALHNQAKSLLIRTQKLVRMYRQQQIDTHITQLKSYLSQAQYGFAKLYDENQ